MLQDSYDLTELNRNQELEGSLNVPASTDGSWSNPKRTCDGQLCYKILAEQIFDALLIVDATTGLIIDFNTRAHEILEFTREEFQGMELSHIETEDSSEQLHRHIKTMLLQGQDTFLSQLLTKHGEIRRFMVNVQVLSGGREGIFQCVLNDITEDERGKEALSKSVAQLRQAQRLESLGTLAGGIAHDFNNILTPIVGFAEMAREMINESEPSEYLDNVLLAATSARELVGQILTFSRRTEQRFSIVQLHPIVKECIKMLKAWTPPKIEIRSVVDCDAGKTLADPTQLNQVLMNLCTNACYAMRDDGGVLEICLERVVLVKPLTSVHGRLEPGPKLRLTVRDTGTGMDEDVLEHIFEPFFTTKPEEDGTGLGLSVVYGIVEGQGGIIRVNSEPGKGTTFQIYFDAVKGEKPVSDNDDGKVIGGKEHILFVDDDGCITDVANEILKYHGYQVTTTSLPGDALDLIRSHPKEYDLLITDQIMPVLSGVQLAAAVMEIRKDLPIILVSGYNRTVSPQDFRKFGFRYYLKKPLSMGSLCKAVREVLDTPYPLE